MEGEPTVTTEAEREALGAINAYLDAFNARDLKGTDAALNFPHVRIASGRVMTWETPGQLPDDFFERFTTRFDWDHSEWDYRRVAQSADDKVHFAVCFTRYRADGSKIGRFESIWIVTRQQNHWGIQARSSFAP